MTEPSWLDVWRTNAERGMPTHVRDYFAAVAGAPATHSSGEWPEVRFRPRVLVGDRTLEVSTSVLGAPVSTPLLIAPMAQQVAADPLGERATAVAAERFGTIMGVSVNSAVPFAEITAAGAGWWFQSYLLGSRALTQTVARRAAEAGASAVILTVDTTIRGVRERGVEPTEWPEGPARARLMNLTDSERATVRAAAPLSPRPDDIALLKEATGLPVVVKGVLRGDDAERAIDAGADALIVSTHGDRRMPGSIGTFDALAAVVEAAGPRAEVYVDSGIRSGAHILAALAIGARAVFVGRPALWGLAADGAAGVEAVLAGLSDELVVALDQSGAAGIHHLDPDLVVR